MTHRGEQTPEHLLIKIAHRDDPVSAVTEDDAHRRRISYPHIRTAAPVFGYAEELDGRWRILSLLGSEPQGTRDGLGSHFRRLLSKATDEAERAEYEAAIRLLDWEVVNDLTVNGRRYRIIRAQPFVRMGPDGPEPPRPTDPDPYPPGRSREAPSRVEGFVIDPAAETGLAEGLLRLEVLPSVYQSDLVPEDVRADSRRALETHPGGVLLPVAFTTGEYVDGHWRPRVFGSYPTPQGARDSLTFNFREFIPRFERPSEEIIAEYARAADQLDATRADEIEVRGVRYRVTRVEQLVRVGPDGPEGPRPSDWDPEPPPELHFQQLREQGLLDAEPGPD